MGKLSNHQSNDPAYIQEMFGHPVIVDDKGCWIWQGPKATNGYARIRNDTVHSLVWYFINGKPKPGYEVCHSCCVKLCVNIKHLYEGTRKQNMSDPDMVKVYKRIRKLDEHDYEAIPILHAQGWTKVDIGKLLQVSGEHIGKVLKGEIRNG